MMTQSYISILSTSLSTFLTRNHKTFKKKKKPYLLSQVLQEWYIINTILDACERNNIHTGYLRALGFNSLKKPPAPN